MHKLAEVLRRIPVVRLLLPFVAGIVTGILGAETSGQILLVIFVLSFLFIAGIYLWMGSRYERRYWYGLAIHIFLFIGGWFYTSQTLSYTGRSAKQPMTGVFLAEVQDVQKNYAGHIQAKCRVMCQWDSIQCITRHVNALTIFPAGTDSFYIFPGARFLFSGQIIPVRTPMNPGEFNYKRYLLYKGISGRIYLNDGAFTWVSPPHKTFRYYAWSARKAMINIIRKNGIKGQEFAVLSALTLGYREAISDETLRAYSSSGAMHILSVSGLHVGVIYLIVDLFLRFFRRFRYGRYLRLGIGMLVLWTYALLTGCSPSVMRASAMFSFVLVGTSLERPVSVYNSLATSAFSLLLIDPLMLTQIGFQLSYLAVCSIVTIYPKINTLVRPHTWLGRQLWDLVCLSLAAQVGTFPLGLFYFNRFPNFFLLTNILVVPLSALIIYGAVLLFAFSWWNWAAFYIAKGLGFSVWLLNHTVGWIENLPGSSSSEVPFSLSALFIVSLIVIGISALLYTHRSWLMVASLSLLLTLTGVGIWRKWTALQQRGIVVYCIPGHTAVDIIHGREHLLVTDSSLVYTPAKVAMRAGNFWRNRYLTSVPVYQGLNCIPGKFPSCFYAKQLRSGCWYFSEGKHRVALITGEYAREPSVSTLATDVLVLSCNRYIPLSKLIGAFMPCRIVVDASVPAWCSAQWEREAMAFGIDFHSVNKTGACLVGL